jgi:cell division protein FtsI/penicillin-binding protein 2
VWVRDDESNGTLSVKNILAHSSNIGAYKVAKRLGAERFHEYIQRFGLGSRALGLPREAAGIVRPLEKWNGGTSLSRIAMGYEVSVTPLQMAMVVSSIANRGALMKPRLVDRLVSYDKKEVEVLPPVIVRQACSAATARKIADSLEAAVVEGTGKQAAIEGLRVAGKTGTAQRYDPEAKGKDKYPDGHFVVSFAGFAPVENPRIACVIVIDDPKSSEKGQLYGGKLAAPVFAKVVGRAFELMAIAPERPTAVTLNQDSTGGAQP